MCSYMFKNNVASNYKILQIIYIVIHRQTISLYQNSSVWLDTSKPVQLYVKLWFRPLVHQADHVG